MGETGTQTETKEATFIARGDLHLIRKRTPEKRSEAGKLIPIGAGLSYQFAEQQPMTFRAGQDILVREDTGEEEDAITWLRRHPQLGDAFWEIELPKPDPSELLLEIGRLGVRHDMERLAELYLEERDGYNRQPVINAIEAASGAIEALPAEPVGAGA